MASHLPRRWIHKQTAKNSSCHTGWAYFYRNYQFLNTGWLKPWHSRNCDKAHKERRLFLTKLRLLMILCFILTDWNFKIHWKASYSTTAFIKLFLDFKFELYTKSPINSNTKVVNELKFKNLHFKLICKLHFVDKQPTYKQVIWFFTLK